MEIVVHADIVGVETATVQLLGNLHGCGGLARTRGAGEQDNGAVGTVIQDAFRRKADFFVVGVIRFLNKALRVGNGAEIDLAQIVGHKESSLPEVG